MQTLRAENRRKGSAKTQTYPRRQRCQMKVEGFTRILGSTTYRVGVHFSQSASETMEDKLIRLLYQEAGR